MSLGDLQIIAFCSYLHFTQLPNSHTDIEGTVKQAGQNCLGVGEMI